MAAEPSDERGVTTAELDALVQDTEFFRSLVENGSDAIVSINEQSTILYANRSVERVFGYSPEEMVGEKLTMIMPDRFQADHFGAIDRYVDTGERNLNWNNIELPAEHKDGHEIPLSITFEEHAYEGDRVFSGIMRDISEQKAYQSTLESLQEITRDLMQARTTEAIAEEVVGAVEDVIGFPVASLYEHDDAADVLRPVAHSETVDDLFDDPPVLADGSLAWLAFEDGTPREYQGDNDSDAPIERPSGPIESEYIVPLGEYGCLLVSDTEPATFDEQTTNLIQILAANTEAALSRAEREAERERQRERLERFASIVSHDLRDPLQSARATTAVARAGDESALADLEDIFDRMEELIEDVLTLAKQGQTVGGTEPVNLDVVAQNAWSTTGSDAATLALEPDLPTLQADNERLRTLLENLFRNALEHGGDGATVRVGPVGEDAGFYVADDGEGFGDADPDQLFEYGYTTNEDGTGFGLSIVRDVVTAHGWTITATDSEDGGARFEVDTR
jgi:PAS domain S-box-containing protein